MIYDALRWLTGEDHYELCDSKSIGCWRLLRESNVVRDHRRIDRIESSSNVREKPLGEHRSE